VYRLSYAEWSAAEYWAALRSVLGGRIAQGAQPQRLADALAQRYAPSRAYPVNFGHVAIGLALAAFARRVPGRKQVVVPAFICPSVPQAIRAQGLDVVWAPVRTDLNLDPARLGACIGHDTLAVVAPHMYGCPAAIGEIAATCKAAGVFMVDDAAQLAGVEHGGRLLGTWGDVGILSFAQSKGVVTGIRGSGGVLLVNNPAFDAELAAAVAALPVPRGRLRALAEFVWNYLWEGYTGKSGYYLARLFAMLGLKAPQVSGPARISNLEAGIALAQLARLDRLNAARVASVERYHQALQAIGVDFPQYAPGRCLSRVMVAMPPGADLARVRAALQHEGVQSRLAYAVPPEADPAWNTQLLGLPFRGDMPKTEIEAICSSLQRAIRSQ